MAAEPTAKTSAGGVDASDQALPSKWRTCPPSGVAACGHGEAGARVVTITAASPREVRSNRATYCASGPRPLIPTSAAPGAAKDVTVKTPNCPALLLATSNAADNTILRSILAELGAIAIDDVANGIARMSEGAIDAMIVDAAAGERLVGLARRVDPRIDVIVVERPFDRRAVRLLIERAIAQRQEAAPIALSTQRENREDPLPLVLQRPLRAADVLIVDDDALLLRTMDRTVRSVGFSTFNSPTPGLAGEVLRTTRFQMLILDVWMPGVSGIELARQTRNGKFGGANRHTPIVFVTSDDSAGTYEKTFDLDAARCLIKPFDCDVFSQLVASTLGRAA